MDGRQSLLRHWPLPQLQYITAQIRESVSTTAVKSLQMQATTEKKHVVKAVGFPYQFGQMHRVGAGVNRFYPPNLRTHEKCTETTN